MAKRVVFINIYQGAVERGLETFAREISQRVGADLLLGNKKPASRWPILWRLYLDPHGIQTFLQTLRFLPKVFGGRYDVVVPLNGGWQPALIRLATWIYGRKMVCVGQSGIGWDDRNNLWCFPDRFVAISGRARDWAKRFNPFVKSVYIPNGVDLDKFTSSGEKYPLPFKDGKTVLCVAGLSKQKNVAKTISAVSKIAKTNLLVVGDGQERHKLETLGRKLLGERFLIIPRLPHNNMPAIYRSVSAFTLASFEREAFGIAYLEAMASGLGVVATDDSQRREIVGGAGLFVNPGDTKSYADALRRVLDKNWGEIPREQAQKFSWAKAAREYETMFTNL